MKLSLPIFCVFTLSATLGCAGEAPDPSNGAPVERGTEHSSNVAEPPTLDPASEPAFPPNRTVQDSGGSNVNLSAPVVSSNDVGHL